MSTVNIDSRGYGKYNQVGKGANESFFFEERGQSIIRFKVYA